MPKAGFLTFDTGRGGGAGKGEGRSKASLPAHPELPNPGRFMIMRRKLAPGAEQLRGRGETRAGERLGRGVSNYQNKKNNLLLFFLNNAPFDTGCLKRMHSGP